MVSARQNQKSESIKNYYDAKFLICNSCLWCASWLIDDYFIQSCPTCRSEKLELTPITRTEGYHIKMDGNGVSMEFWNLKKY